MQIPEEILIDAAYELRSHGVDVNVSPIDPSGAVLVAEGVNWAAKAIDERFYEIKAMVAVAAAMTPGVNYAWGLDESNRDVLYLTAEGAGEVAFHDPFGEIPKAAKKLGLELVINLDHQWSGVRRQALAFAALKCRSVRKLIAAATSGEQKWTDAHLQRFASRLGAI